MQLAVPCYGAHPKYVRLLALWLEHYWATRCQFPVYVLTDRHCQIPEQSLLPNVTVLRLDPLQFAPLLREGCPFDIKGALILGALRQLSACVIMDTDALPLQNLKPYLDRLPDHPMIGMAQDGGLRRVPGTDLHELNAGVLYFPKASPQAREAIISAYALAFEELKARCDAYGLEQLAWSLVWHRLKEQGLATLLPKGLNWSRFWPVSADTVIMHEHGEGKWAKYGLNREVRHA